MTTERAHQPMFTRRTSSAAALLGFAIVASACGGSSDAPLVRQSDSNRVTIVDPSPVPTSTTVVPAPAPIPTTPPPAPAPAAESVRFSPFTVVDPMSNGIAAFTVLVPEGWNASGEVEWQPFWSRLAQHHTTVVDPATGLQVDWLPIQDFMYFTPPAGFEVPIGGNYQGKAYVAPIADPEQFVREFWMGGALAHLQQSTVTRRVELPALADEFVARFGGPATAGAWTIRYEFEVGGIVWEQDVTFALLYSGTDPVSWYVNYATAAAAPKGELDRQQSLVSTVIASRLSTVEWEANYRLVQQLFYQGIQQQMADTVAFGELLAQYRAESQALQQQVFDDRMASQDRQNQLWRETVGGVEGFDDPVNGTVVQLPLSWDRYFVNENGEYLAVSDPNFDPNSMNDGTWVEMQPRA